MDLAKDHPCAGQRVLPYSCAISQSLSKRVTKVAEMLWLYKIVHKANVVASLSSFQ